LKTRINNKEGFEQMVLQNDKVLTQIKAIDGNAMWNVSKGGKM
jgi:hypothetical protein